MFFSFFSLKRKKRTKRKKSESAAISCGGVFVYKKTMRKSHGSIEAIAGEKKWKGERSLRRLGCSEGVNGTWRPVEAPLSKGSWIAEGKTEGIDTENVTFRYSVGKESLRRSIPSVTADEYAMNKFFKRYNAYSLSGYRALRAPKKS